MILPNDLFDTALVVAGVVLVARAGPEALVE